MTPQTLSKAELKSALERAFAIEKANFTVFGLEDWLGLSCFSDAEVATVAGPWLKYDSEENLQFGPWLSKHDSTLHQRYKQQLDNVWAALQEHCGLTDPPTIGKVQMALYKLKDEV